MRNVPEKIVEKIETQIFCSVTHFWKSCLFEITWKNMVEPRGPQLKISSVLLISWINKATDTHPEYAVLMTFPLQKWLGERGSMLLLCMYFSSCFSQFSLGLYLTVFDLYYRIWRHLTYLTVFNCVCVGSIWLIWPMLPYLTHLTYLTAFVLAVFD